MMGTAEPRIQTDGLDWHLGMLGPPDGVPMLLLHGTGASGHSWRNLAPILSARHRLLIPDLPGHGQTRTGRHADLSLPGMVGALKRLLAALDFRPEVIIGHSAGAAIAIALAAGMVHPPRLVVGINGAYLPIRGARLFSPMAKLLFANPLSAPVLAFLTRNTPLTDSLLSATGSAIDRQGEESYRRLLHQPEHVRGALGMMAAWDLTRFDDALRALACPLLLLAAQDDPMVPCENSRHAARLCARAELILSSKGGHLLHECAADQVAKQIETIVAGQTIGGVDAA